MNPSPETLLELSAFAEEVSRRAGQVLTEHSARRSEWQAEFKGRREMVTEADRAAERQVVGSIAQRFPDHAILAEEGELTPKGQASGSADMLWIVDPLDGTTNFVHGLPFYCVALALAVRGEVVLGVVHAPVLQQTYVAARGQGARCEGKPIRVTTTGEIGDALLATGFSYRRDEPGHDDNSSRVQRILPLCRDLRRFGSAQLDLCLTAAGHFDGYWERDLMPYDVAAGAVIVCEAGGQVTDLQGGQDWLYGQQILASNGLLHPGLLQILGLGPHD